MRASVVRKQSTDAHDALHILALLVSDRFPRIWIPSLGERAARWSRSPSLASWRCGCTGGCEKQLRGSHAG